ncbi:FAD-dependent monooxygenase [Shinella yambaruensis]|uniref:Glutamate synthase n=1 Tax=Shinella yambaruensis TaxID=415996 RepID=A0ABQ5ZNQ3_9HYPH|nr:NAD(P)/FAD-dependent oxidoreductase [Shinella yambaruensis]MCJ8025223.1 FAD-dependent monooxygenase [Shinella yambaruensis]MCU7981143.1 FAD-dependent monooxygenase [Shinella yambaruensis]GLR53715.1 glutamate synthase [Shinella yambaruensis]
MKPLDIGIAGAGPAGLAAALFLSRAGHRVELIERFEQPSPVGSGLLMQPTGLTVLDALGLSPAIHALGNRIDRLHGADARSGRTVLDVRYDALAGGRYGLAVHRAALFATLHDAVAAAGLPIRTGITLAKAETRQARTALHDPEGGIVGDYDLVVDATGARSQLAAASVVAPAVRELPWGAFWATLDCDGIPHDARALAQRYDAAKVMIGVLPVGRAHAGEGRKVAFFWSLRAADADAVRQAGLQRWKGRILDYWPETAPFLDQITDWDQLTLARYAHRTTLPPVADGIAFIGDSAHSTSPQLGQGANMALLDAAALAHALATAASLEEGLAAYAAARRNHVRLFQLLSYVFTPFYQSDSRAIAWLRDRLVATVAKIPPAPQVLAAIVSGTLVDPFIRAGLQECRWLERALQEA